MSSPSLMTPPPSLITRPPSCMTSPTPFSACSNIPSPSFEKVDQLFASLAECFNKPAILALVKDYSSNYIPSSLAADLPLCLTDIYNTEYLKKAFSDLLQIVEETEVSVSASQAKAVSEKSRLWFQMKLDKSQHLN